MDSRNEQPAWFRVGANKAKSQGGADGPWGVGPTHSRGVAGVMPGGAGSDQRPEGEGGQTQDCRDTPVMHRHEMMVGTKLQSIAERARREPTAKFHNVAHLLDKDLLQECFYALRREGAVGVDGVAWEVP